jgi:NADPH-dependent 2,4-dienoyl-CoA reductase/sulfur reductase-like enzyme
MSSSSGQVRPASQPLTCYRAPPPELGLDVDSLLGTEAAKFHRVHATFDRVRNACDYRSRTTAWGVFDNTLYVHGPAGQATITYDALILATGATDRVLPLPGWTLPGVFTLGGAQVLLKDQGCLIGRRVVFCGSSPLLYLAALQYRQMGAEIAAILDTTSFLRKVRAARDLLASPGTLRRGLAYMAKLKACGVRIAQGARLLAFEGERTVSAVLYRRGEGPPQRVACDAVAFGFGLKPETQLAELAGCRLAYNQHFRQWLPAADADGRCGNGLYVAGDGATIGGADAAELSGAIAAHALLHDLRMNAHAVPDLGAMRRELTRLRRFQRGLARAFAWPFEEAEWIGDDVIVCRCENVTAGELRDALFADLPACEVNRAKALTRCGMGRCQGRFCGLAVAEIMAAALRRPLEQSGHLRAQAPVKPLPMTAGDGA